MAGRSPGTGIETYFWVLSWVFWKKSFAGAKNRHQSPHHPLFADRAHGSPLGMMRHYCPRPRALSCRDGDKWAQL